MNRLEKDLDCIDAGRDAGGGRTRSYRGRDAGGGMPGGMPGGTLGGMPGGMPGGTDTGRDRCRVGRTRSHQGRNARGRGDGREATGGGMTGGMPGGWMCIFQGWNARGDTERDTVGDAGRDAGGIDAGKTYTGGDAGRDARGADAKPPGGIDAKPSGKERREDGCEATGEGTPGRRDAKPPRGDIGGDGCGGGMRERQSEN